MGKSKGSNNRKIGSRVEALEVVLTPAEIERERIRVVDLVQARAALDEKKKAAMAEFKARASEIDAARDEAVSAVRSGRVRRDVVVEEWITGGNEVVRLVPSTGEILGTRPATAEDLQERLPVDAPASDDAEDFA